MSTSEIGKAVRELERERRKATQELMRDYDERYYLPNIRELREACSAIGHKWRFTHLGPLNDPWFSCGVCGQSECRREEKS